MGWKHREDIFTLRSPCETILRSWICGESSMYSMCRRIRQLSCKGNFFGSNVEADLSRGVFGGISRRIDMQGLTKRVDGLILDGDCSGCSRR